MSKRRKKAFKQYIKELKKSNGKLSSIAAWAFVLKLEERDGKKKKKSSTKEKKASSA
jgi:hypothetical protein